MAERLKTMLRFIDVSNWQRGLDVSKLDIDAVIVKATEGTTYVDPTCDGFVQQCIKLGIPWGFYHFARNNTPENDAYYFVKNTANYFGSGIPVLDLEDSAISDWDDYATRFCKYVHGMTNVWPMIYVSAGMASRIVVGKVLKNCAFWIAGYPKAYTGFVDVSYPYKSMTPDKNVVMWQFTSSGRLGGYDGNLDLNYGYLTREQWDRYAKGDSKQDSTAQEASTKSVLENDEFKVTIQKK